MLEREPRYVKAEDPKYLKELLQYPAEAKDVEYKAAVKFDERTVFAAKLTKQILGFANSGGGYLIIGYKEQSDGSHAPDPDITDEIVASYDVTRLCQHIGKYLDGQDRIKMTIRKEEFAGIRYPIIRIHQFQDCPLFCTKNYVSPECGDNILELGKVYIRTEEARIRVAATVEEPSEWRQLIRVIAKDVR